MIIQKNNNDNIRGLQFMGVMNITPEIASKMLEKNFVNRKVNKDRVATYAHDIKAGAWEKISDGLSLQFDSDGNLMNGQHRLNAIIQSETPLEMFIFQSNISSTAMAVPFDTGMIRSLALVTKKSKDYVSMISFFIDKGTEYSRVTPSIMTNFENSLNADELDMLEKITNRKIKGLTIAIRSAFFFAYVKRIKSKEEILSLFYSCVNNDFTNALANEIRTFGLTSANTIKSGMPCATSNRNAMFVYTYGMICQYTSRKYKTESFINETMQALKDWMKGRV